jgi:hypothetical protein
MFTARYALGYLKQTRFAFKGLRILTEECPLRFVTERERGATYLFFAKKAVRRTLADINPLKTKPICFR